MTIFEPEKEDTSSYYRFWSGMHWLANNYGEVDNEKMLREIAPLHTIYEKDGTVHPPDPHTGVPWKTGTFCAHNLRQVSQEHPLGRNGNTESTVFNLSTLEVWYVPVWPCHYKEWNLSWNYLNLQPFADYRTLLEDKP